MGLRLGGEGGQVKLYTPLRVVKKLCLRIVCFVLVLSIT